VKRKKFLRPILKNAATQALVLGLGGCFFPQAGPSTVEIVSEAEIASAPYEIIPLEVRSIEILKGAESSGLAGAFRDRREQRSNLVSVVGEVNTPIRHPAANLGARDRIMDAITRAGGIKPQGYET
jgi:hypothetical protein